MHNFRLIGGVTHQNNTNPARNGGHFSTLY